MKSPSKERTVLEDLRAGATEEGWRLFRRNVGKAWVATGPEKTSVVIAKRAGAYHLNPGDVILRKARRFVSGVEGQADLQGWVQVEITPEMVGMKVPIAAEIEAKDKAKATVAQLQWLKMCRSHGVIAGVCHNMHELRSLVSTIYGSRK